jgi:hypothetical protein
MKVSFETSKSIRENSRLQSAQFGGREEEVVRNEDDCWPTPAVEILASAVASLFHLDVQSLSRIISKNVNHLDNYFVRSGVCILELC